MAIIIKTEFESAVTKANEDLFTKSYIENGTTIIEFDVRKRNYKKIYNTKSKVKWDEEYSVDIGEISTLYCPIKYRFLIARGNYYDEDGNRQFFTPTIDEISTSQHVSKSLVRLSSYLAVKCGVSLRNISVVFSIIFLIKISKSSIKRWIDSIGENLPSEEEILKKLILAKEPEECHIDGYYPMGTNNCVMVVKDENDRILMTHETDSENKEEAIKFLQKIKNCGINVVSAFSDYSKSFTEAIREIFPDANFQADHFHTVKNIWKQLKKAYLEFRKTIKADSKKCRSKKAKRKIEELSNKLWELRWVVLKKPCNLSKDDTKKLKELEKIEEQGFVKNFRSILKCIVKIFDKSKTEISAKNRLKLLRAKMISSKKNTYYQKIINFFDEHWNEAMNYLKNDNKKRASNSESGMRLLRRLEKNHDGIRSPETRKNYVKIYQIMTYLKELDIAGFIDDLAPD